MLCVLLLAPRSADQQVKSVNIVFEKAVRDTVLKAVGVLGKYLLAL